MTAEFVPGAAEDQSARVPLVSVIIPTIRRPTLLRRAIRSVQAQTYPEIETIVVVDGRDPETDAVLAALQESRLRVIRNEVSIGPGPARNAAARIASGAWLAFLDDDDEWLPRKIEVQLAEADLDQPVILSCRCRVETPRAAFTWPDRLIGLAEPVDEYLFRRRSLFRGEAYLATPTFVLPAWLFAKVEFGGTDQNEDTTLLLRATKQHGGQIRMLPETLVIIHTEEQRESKGSTYSWRASLDWIDSMGKMITRPAYSGFCLVTLGSQAARQGDFAAVPELLRRAFRRGAPTWRQLALFASFWATPTGMRRRIRALTRSEPPSGRPPVTLQPR